MLSDISIDECKKALEKAGVPPAQVLADYMHQLLDWNTKINLTGAKDPNELAVKHIADVWAAVQVLGISESRIADIGSGGGIPGIVLAIIAPQSHVTLVERRQKKANVLQSMVSKLGLDEKMRVYAKSFEEVKTFTPDTEFWFRGFLPGPKLASYLSEAFPRAQLGQLVLMKGPAWPQEKLEIMSQPKIREAWLERFGGAAELPYSLPNGAGERILVLV